MRKHFSLTSGLVDKNVEITYKAFPITDKNSKSPNEEWLLEFQTIEPKMFFLNVQLLDSELPRILAEVVLLNYQHIKADTSELLAIIKKENPLKYNLEQGHNFYKKKLACLLYHLASGMNSKKVWKGSVDPNIEFVIEKKYSDDIYFLKYDFNLFQEYLISNTEFEIASSGEDENYSKHSRTKKTRKPHQHGWLSQDSGEYYLKLNLQIRFC